jgi:serine/threonine protein kinase
MDEQASHNGRRIGNYRLVKLLGRGGFAEVYLAEHIHINTQAAVKLLSTQLANEDIEVFRNEARMIASLVHPHIIRVLDFGVENSVPYLVMDYAPRFWHSSGCSKFPLSKDAKHRWHTRLYGTRADSSSSTSCQRSSMQLPCHLHYAFSHQICQLQSNKLY